MAAHPYPKIMGVPPRAFEKFGIQKLILEIKRANFGNQKLILEIKRTNFGNQKLILEIKRTNFGNQN